MITFDRYDEEVIYDVTLVTGKTYRGVFNFTDAALPDGMVSFDIYEPDETKTQKWIHLNPAHVVSVQVWLD